MSPVLSVFLSWVLPMLIFIGIGQMMSKKLMNKAGGPNSLMFNTGKNNAKVYVKSSDGITFDIKQVLSEPIKMQIPKIIVLHNHPSGVPEPSLADIEFTKRLDKACLLLGIELLDHIIIGDGIFQNIDWKG